MTVADIFTALTENRPYREGLGKEKVTEILNDLVNKNALDPKVVELLFNNYDEVNSVREEAQELSKQEYKDYVENMSAFS